LLPFEGMRYGPVSWRRFRRPDAPLLRFTTLQSLISARPAGSVVLLRRLVRRFPSGRDVFHRAPSAVYSRKRLHPLIGPCLFRVLQLVSALRPARAWRGAPSLGLAFPLRDINRRYPCGGLPFPSPFRPRRFSRPRRLTPPPALRVYFTPLPRPGFSLQGVPLSHSRSTSSVAVPSRRWR